MKEINLQVSIDEANLILEALGNLPFARVYTLIGKIQEQAGEQLQEVGPGAASEKPSAAAPTIEEGATLECGGKKPADKDKGYYYEPTVFSGATREMTIFKEEIFGPLSAIYSFKTEDEELA